MVSPAAVRGREVRQRLLAAAVELIPERGWSAVSTRVLAERAGVTPSVVHYHFPSLAAVLTEAAVGVMRQVVTGFDAVLGEARTPTELIDLIVGSFERYTGADQVSLLGVEAYLAASRDEQLRAQIAEVVTEFRRRLARWLARHGVAECEETAAVLTGSIDALVLHRGLGVGSDAAAVSTVLYRLVTTGAAEGERK